MAPTKYVTDAALGLLTGGPTDCVGDASPPTAVVPGVGDAPRTTPPTSRNPVRRASVCLLLTIMTAGYFVGPTAVPSPPDHHRQLQGPAHSEAAHRDGGLRYL